MAEEHKMNEEFLRVLKQNEESGFSSYIDWSWHEKAVDDTPPIYYAKVKIISVSKPIGDSQKFAEHVRQMLRVDEFEPGPPDNKGALMEWDNLMNNITKDTLGYHLTLTVTRYNLKHFIQALDSCNWVTDDCDDSEQTHYYMVCCVLL